MEYRVPLGIVCVSVSYHHKNWTLQQTPLGTQASLNTGSSQLICWQTPLLLYANICRILKHKEQAAVSHIIRILVLIAVILVIMDQKQAHQLIKANYLQYLRFGNKISFHFPFKNSFIAHIFFVYLWILFPKVDVSPILEASDGKKESIKHVPQVSTYFFHIT